MTSATTSIRSLDCVGTAVISPPLSPRALPDGRSGSVVTLFTPTAAAGAAATPAASAAGAAAPLSVEGTRRASFPFAADLAALAMLSVACASTFVAAMLARPGVAVDDSSHLVVILTALFPWNCAIHQRLGLGWVVAAFAVGVPVPYLTTLPTRDGSIQIVFLCAALLIILLLFPCWLLHECVLGRRLFRMRLLVPYARRVADGKRVAYELIIDSFPRVIADFTRSHRAAGIGISMLCDTAVTCIRFDGLVSTYSDEQNAIALAGEVDAVVSVLDEAVARHCTVVGCVNIFGDSALLGGPFKIGGTGARDAMADYPSIRACRETLNVLFELRSRGIRFSSASTVDTCFATVTDVDYPTFDLLGRAVNVSRLVVNAGIAGTIVCNELFAKLYAAQRGGPAPGGASSSQRHNHNHQQQQQTEPPLFPASVFAPARQWRIRSLGMLLLHAIRFPQMLSHGGLSSGGEATQSLSGVSPSRNVTPTSPVPPQFPISGSGVSGSSVLSSPTEEAVAVTPGRSVFQNVSVEPPAAIV